MPQRAPISIKIITIFSLCFLLFQGCGGIGGGIGQKEEKAEVGEPLYDASFEGEEYEKELPAPSAERSAPSEKTAVAASGVADMPPEEFQRPVVAPEERKRVYSGYCKLSVDSVEKRKDEIFGIAEDSGGWVEQAAGNIVVIRVPADVFEETFSKILLLGEIIDRAIETEDVTEQYSDLITRLKLARETRERLYRLLERTDDVTERLLILREIRRLTDEIEEIRQRLDLLKELVAFSRITADLIPRLAYETAYRENIPFAWIRNLDPVYVSIYELSGKILFQLPEDFAVFEKEDSFRAESADGTRVRIGTVPNEPAGDGLFWRRALEYHLDDFYGESEALSTGSAACILFTSKDREPFYYLVGVLAVKKKLYVIETFFPSEESLGRRYNDIERSITELEVR
jgi:hypothetical protein